MPFLDIFSKKGKSKAKEKKEQIKIIADYREKNSLVISELSALGAEVQIKNLQVADFLIQNTAVERKTASDFISSMINKRLFRQLEEIKQYPQHFLLIEGNLQEQPFTNQNALRGFILSIIQDYKVPIIYSENEKESALFLYLLAKKSKNSDSIRANKKILSKKEQLQYILEGFPGIGPSSAKKLLKKYKSLSALFKAPIADIKNTIGKKSNIFQLLEERY